MGILTVRSLRISLIPSFVVISVSFVPKTLPIHFYFICLCGAKLRIYFQSTYIYHHILLFFIYFD